MYESKQYLILFLISLLVPVIQSSEGDRSPFYQNCVKKCKTTNCTSDDQFKLESAQLQDTWDWLLWWNCNDECRYHCMWRTVQGYQDNGFKLPKFHGKWPFRRILGVQEPASAFASVLNLLAHVYMYRKIRREFPGWDTPMIVFWHCFALVCINAWTWSVIFHTRDKYFTEFMDYACALSMVMSLFIAAIARMVKKIYGKIIILLLILYYAEHVRYLYTGQIDYDYNMHTNIFFGVLGCVTWLAWSWAQFVAGRRYVRRLVAFSLLSGAVLLMEIFDNPPRLGWDSHALWHLSTSLLPFIFYRFVIDDLRYLQASVKSDVKLP